MSNLAWVKELHKNAFSEIQLAEQPMKFMVIKYCNLIHITIMIGININCNLLNYYNSTKRFQAGGQNLEAQHPTEAKSSRVKALNNSKFSSRTQNNVIAGITDIFIETEGPHLRTKQLCAMPMTVTRMYLLDHCCS